MPLFIHRAPKQQRQLRRHHSHPMILGTSLHLLLQLLVVLLSMNHNIQLIQSFTPSRRLSLLQSPCRHIKQQSTPQQQKQLHPLSSTIDNEYDPTSELTESQTAQAANTLAATLTNNNDNNNSNNAIIELPTEISTSFMQYALSIILGRALPDARDGMKPVHRRILFAMDGLNLGPTGSYRKCARVVGEVLGKL